MNCFFVAASTLFVFFLTTSQAHAYLDPNSGSLMLQIILGGLAGVAVIIKLYFNKVKSFFRPKKKD